MVFGIGIDICQNSRIHDLYHKYGHRFLRKVFMRDEIEYCLSKKNPVPHLAARFAFKEAFVKALKQEIAAYREIGLTGNHGGAKHPTFTGKAKKMLDELGINNIQCSISHEKSVSTAIVILEKLNNE